ncbi:MAG TPA: twin-arginine translocase TatA/TatE family subunit [Caulobacteraceae bacterium]|jgi:sec-independent protein translocase protein TatA
MGGLSPWHILIIALVALLFFGGKGKLSGIMGDAAKGIKAFKDGLKDDEHKADDKPAASASNAGTLPRTDAEREAVRREEDKHPAA